MRNLREVACGETVRVEAVTGAGAVKRRIMDMGITRGTEIYVRKLSSATTRRASSPTSATITSPPSYSAASKRAAAAGFPYRIGSTAWSRTVISRCRSSRW